MDTNNHGNTYTAGNDEMAGSRKTYLTLSCLYNLMFGAKTTDAHRKNNGIFSLVDPPKNRIHFLNRDLRFGDKPASEKNTQTVKWVSKKEQLIIGGSVTDTDLKGFMYSHKGEHKRFYKGGKNTYQSYADQLNKDPSAVALLEDSARGLVTEQCKSEESLRTLNQALERFIREAAAAETAAGTGERDPLAEAPKKLHAALNLILQALSCNMVNMTIQALKWLFILCCLREDSFELLERDAKKQAKASPQSVSSFSFDLWRASKAWLAAAESGDRRFSGWDIVENLFPVLKTGIDKDQAAAFQTTVSDPEAGVQGANPVDIIGDSNDHFYLVGEGGIGKTTMLRKLLKEGLGDIYSSTGKVPVFIELASAPVRECAAYEDGQSTFILRSVYNLMHPDHAASSPFIGMPRAFTANMNDVAIPVWEEFTRDSGSPEYILLLDGLNEVSRMEVDGYSIVSMVCGEIREIISKCKNVQVILTSRSAENLGDGIKSLYLEGVTDKTIGDYLKDLPSEKGFTEDEIRDILANKQLFKVLRIPLFLTMYAKLENRTGIMAGGELLRAFFHERSEQLYNQRQRLEETNRKLDARQMCFLLDIVLPEIGYVMERDRTYEITGSQVRAVLDRIMEKYADPDDAYTGYANRVFNQYTEKGNRRQNLSYTAKQLNGLGDPEDVKAIVLDCTIEQLGILYEAGDGIQKRYSFRHQHLRDYFAAQRYINDLRVAVFAWETFMETQDRSCKADADHCLAAFQENYISRPVRIFIGEVLGEHHNAPEWDKETGLWKYNVPETAWIYKDTDISAENRDRNLIKKSFDILRGKRADIADYTIYNLIHILDGVRKDLRGSDLRGLDLTGISLNDIMLGEGGLAADMDGAKIDPNSFYGLWHNGPVNSASFSSDGSLLATASWNGTARIWDARTGQVLHVLEGHMIPVNSASFSRGGSLLATASDDHTAMIWDVKTGQVLHVLKGHTDEVNSASFSCDGSILATASDDGTARIWDARTGQLLHVLTGHTGRVGSASFSCDGSLLATASGDRTARIWDVKTGQLLHVLEGHMRRVNSASFSCGGSLLATASDDSTARIWNVKTGKCLHVLKRHTDWVNSASFSCDGSLLATASGDRTARIWDVKTGQLLHVLEGHMIPVNSASFSCDGSLLATASGDRTARIWDVKTGQPLHVLEGHTDRVRSASFSCDGSLLATASNDGKAMIWDVKTGQHKKKLYHLLGVFLKGVNLKNAIMEPPLTDVQKEQLRQYGAII